MNLHYVSVSCVLALGGFMEAVGLFLSCYLVVCVYSGGEGGKGVQYLKPVFHWSHHGLTF